MAARVALLLSAVFLCLVLGLVSAPSAPAVVAPAHPLRLAELRLDPPGVEAAAAATALAGGASAVAPASPVAAPAPRREAAPAPPQPPPPPGPDAMLRSSVAAVTDEGGRLSLVLAGGGRRLHEGERYMGWTLASVSRTGAVLRKGDARREVAFFAPGATAASGASMSGGTVFPTRPAPAAAAPTAAEFFRGFKG